MLVPRSIALTVVALAGATVLQACGGGKEASQASTSAANTATPANSTATAAPGAAPAAGAATLPPMPATGKTAKVQMIVDNKGDREDPVKVTVKVGDAVQWVNVSGGPHNISFWPDSIPSGADQQLGANMPSQTGAGPADKLGPMAGPLLTAPNDTYTISFAGVKPGVYKYYCTPHLAMGMVGSVTVQ
jgi:plastocyanin